MNNIRIQVIYVFKSVKEFVNLTHEKNNHIPLNHHEISCTTFKNIWIKLMPWLNELLNIMLKFPMHHCELLNIMSKFPMHHCMPASMKSNSKLLTYNLISKKDVQAFLNKALKWSPKLKFLSN